MRRFTLTCKTPYDVVYAKGLLDGAGDYVKAVRGASRAMLVSDSNVEKLYLKRVRESFERSGFSCSQFVFEAGELSKTPATYLNVVSALAKAGFNREDLVVALGGGVVGDVAGFAAATYMRGIDVVQLPTTLLAAIDSSIGGKTGVDLEYGKNLLGAFHQPRLVLCDTETFKTLSETDFKNGLGEGVKYAVLKGGEIFKLLEEGINDENILEFSALCGEAKARIVEADENDNAQRRLLNLGHTFGHAIEKLSGFSVPHGIAVAKGIALMARAAVLAGETEKTEADRVIRMFEKYGIDTSVEFSARELSSCLALDKKSNGSDSVSAVKIGGIGRCYIEKMSFDELENYIGAALSSYES